MPKSAELVREYLKRIGAMGGSSRSPAKQIASRRNAANARAARAAKRAATPSPPPKPTESTAPDITPLP